MKRKLIIALLCLSTAAFAQKKTDFTGKFKVNKERTNFGQAPEFILPRFIIVKQTGDKLIVSRIKLDQQLMELPAVSDTLAFTGNAGFKWLSDTSLQVSKQNGAASWTEIWTLEDQGKTLHLERDVVQSDDFKYHTIAYFDKQ
ncbi:hypothetical protein SAMN05216464_11055 [Mucilaginibacter pineti]|uniref:Lipocalin-like domain-containing protein n=1 Tax=Mucilaginibacter pineti TaxID=1391627 RepID=A0A1G7GAV1_9SPHI|nr:hypothetical protein [Mucilaginibacter pineti]SDE85241.1 hypothetical protein SAMN05216464_11055 [Mucilaginibacter pineti]